MKIAPRLSHRLVGVPPLKLYRTNPLILFCGQTSRGDGVSYVKRTQKCKMTKLLKLVLRKIEKYRNSAKPFNSFCGQYLRVDGKWTEKYVPMRKYRTTKILKYLNTEFRTAANRVTSFCGQKYSWLEIQRRWGCLRKNELLTTSMYPDPDFHKIVLTFSPH